MFRIPIATKRILDHILRIPIISFLLIFFLKLFKPTTEIDDSLYNVEVLKKYHSNKTISCVRNTPIYFDSPEYDLAVVVPCYNVENYICECIDSLLMQKTNYKIQLVIVDDGSLDNTGKILDEKYKHKENVTIVHQYNHGLSAARNEGIAHCSAEFVTFVDSDDYITNPFIFDNILKAIKTSRLRKEDKIIIGYRFSKKAQIENLCKKTRIKEVECLKLKGFACGKVYSSQLFSNVCFPNGYWFEDTINSLLLFHLADKTFFINDDGYFYRKNLESISHLSLSNYKILDTYYVTSLLLEDYFRLNLTSKYINRSFMRQIVYNYKRLKSFNDEINKSVFIESIKLLHNYSFSKNVGLKYYYVFKSLKKGDYSLYRLACNLIR